MVVIHLYAEDNCGAGGCDDISDYQRPIVKHNALNDKKYRSGTHKEESRHSDAIGVSCTDCIDCLREIT